MNKKALSIKTIIGVLLLTTGLSLQASYFTAAQEYEKENYERAYEEFSDLAKIGNVDAIKQLASMYEKGNFVDADLNKAAAWLKVAESIESQTVLDAGSINNSVFAELNKKYGLEHFQQAYLPESRTDSLLSQCIGNTKRDVVKVKRRPGKKAKQSHAITLTVLDAEAKVKNVGMVDVYPESKLFSAYALRAAKQWNYSKNNENQACQKLGDQIILVDQITLAQPNISKRTKAENEQRIQGWLEQAADNNAMAQYLLATAVKYPHKDMLTEQDGRTYLLKSAQNGLGKAQFVLGLKLLSGLEYQQDKSKALNWIKLADENGDKTAGVFLKAFPDIFK